MAHPDHLDLVASPSDNGREHGSRGVVSSKAGLAHPGPVIDYLRQTKRKIKMSVSNVGGADASRGESQAHVLTITHNGSDLVVGPDRDDR